MRHLETIEIPPGKPIHFRPGGNHVMLIDLQYPLKEGDQFPVTFYFENGGFVEVTVLVGAIGATQPGHQMEHSESGHTHGQQAE